MSSPDLDVKCGFGLNKVGSIGLTRSCDEHDEQEFNSSLSVEWRSVVAAFC